MENSPVKPIAITKDGEVVNGHTRVAAAQTLGIKKLPYKIEDAKESNKKD